MIQHILLFALGFLCAVLIALAAAPAIWRRAEILTRRRIEASLPMTTDEIGAERDRLRAEHAISLRKVEIQARSAGDKATRQQVDLARLGQEMKALVAERHATQAAIEGLEAQREALLERIADSGQTIESLGKKLADAAARIEADALETEKIAREAEEQTLLAGGRQIELLTLEGEVERLGGDLAVAISSRKDAEKRLRETMADNKAAQEALRNERRRLSDSEKKIERLMASLSDREDKLERRERERQRLQADAKGAEARRRDTEAQLAEARAEIFRLEAQSAADASPAAAAHPAEQDERAVRDRKRMEERLTLLTRENKKLRAELAATEQIAARLDGGDGNDEALRDEIAALAARIVRSTAEAEGPSSPIHAALAAMPPTAPAGLPPSLAQRIGALREEPAAAS